MSTGCCDHDVKFDGLTAAYKRVLWIVIAINATMFLVEMTAGLTAQSQALKADALDFLGDSVTYSISLAVIGRSLAARSNAALFKGLTLGVFGVWVVGATLYRVYIGAEPQAMTMGVVGFMALTANLISAGLLMKYKDGDANVRSVWLCSRNDAIGNIAVIAAAAGVWGMSSRWPDLIVAGIMASLFLTGAVQILRQAMAEKRACAIEILDSP